MSAHIAASEATKGAETSRASLSILSLMVHVSVIPGFFITVVTVTIGSSQAPPSLVTVATAVKLSHLSG